MTGHVRLRAILDRIYARFVAFCVKAIYCRSGHDGLKRLGSDYGGWWVSASLLADNSFALCCGAGEDISFDVLLNSRYGMRVICVDPTPRSIRHVGRILKSGEEVEFTLDAPEREFLANFDPGRFWFVPSAVWSRPGTLRFYEPKDPQHVSHSAVNLQQTDRYIEVSAETPSMILSRHGVKEIALVKLDIEGAEYEVLTSLMDDGLLPRQLLLEFDEFHHPLSWAYPQRVFHWIRRLAARGYELVCVEESNFLFVRP